MEVKIVIRRKFKQAHTKELLSLFYDFRAQAMKQQGYVSAEILISQTNPREIFVISTWQNMENWLEWKESKIRKEFEAMLEIYQDGPAVYEEFFVAEYPLKLS